MFSHKITAQMNDWWQAYGSNTSSAEWQVYVKNLADLVRVKCGEISEAHGNDGRFGMSGTGGCTRRAVLKLLGYPEQPFTADTLITFHIGHMLESIPIATLRAMGYTVEGTQEPVKAGEMMQSYTDGRITAGPEGLEYPCLLSVKSAGFKMSFFSKDANKIKRNGFAALPFDGVRNAQSSWYAQSQMEMLATGVKQSLVVVVAKDTIQAFREDEWMKKSGSICFYAELIEANEKVQKQLQETWEEAWDFTEPPDGQPLDDSYVEHIPAKYYHKVQGHVEIPEPGSAGGEGKRGFSMWGGPNQEIFPFNPCASCNYRKICAGEKV